MMFNHVLHVETVSEYTCTLTMTCIFKAQQKQIKRKEEMKEEEKEEEEKRIEVENAEPSIVV